jgi:hypothetical protein
MWPLRRRNKVIEWCCYSSPCMKVGEGCFHPMLRYRGTRRLGTRRHRQRGRIPTLCIHPPTTPFFGQGLHCGPVHNSLLRVSSL